MGKNISIPAGVRDTGVTLQSALVYSSLLENFVKGKGGIVKVKEIAEAGNMTEDQVRQEMLSLQYKDMVLSVEATFVPRGYRVAKLCIHVEPCIREEDDDDGQEEIDFGSDQKPDRYETGEEKFEIDGVEYVAKAFPTEEAYALTITRISDGFNMADVDAADRADAWRFIDEWKKGPKAEPAPKINVLEWLAYQRKDGILTHDQELRFAPRSFWAVVDALGIERKLLEAEPFPMVENVLESYDVPFTVVLGDKETGFVIEGYEEIEEASLFDQPAEEPKTEPAEETKAEFTVIVSLDGVETEVVVHHEPNFLKEDEPMDKFVFVCQDVSTEKLIANARVPAGQALYEFARDLAQKTLDEADSVA
jgi:hypothetical protein